MDVFENHKERRIKELRERTRKFGNRKKIKMEVK